MSDIFFDEIIYETSKGEIKLGDWVFNIRFNTIIRVDNKEKIIGKDENIPTLIINDINKFNILLKEYLECSRKFYNGLNKKIENKYMDKFLLSILWANATVDDFNNPIQFLTKRIEMLNNNCLDKYNNREYEFCNSYIENTNILVNNSFGSINQEAPYLFSVSFINRDNSDENYKFHNINYGICNNECHIYTVSGNYNDKNNKYNKRINKFLYKINDDYTNSDDDTTYENIREVTLNAIVSLSVFISVLQKEGINKIILHDYLPVRYLGRETSTIKRSNTIYKDNKEEYILEKEKDNERIQRNLSDKFFRNFRRLAYHFNNIEILSNPFETSSSVIIRINNNKEMKCNNNLLESIYNSINDERRFNK